MTKLTLPRCDWCNVTGAYICKRCNKWTCNSCLVEITDDDTCIHRKYEIPKSSDWWFHGPY